MAVVASATGAAVFGLTAGTAAAGIAGGALLGAGAGALYSGITGDGNILNSALTGGLIGGGIGGLGAGLFGTTAATGMQGAATAALGGSGGAFVPAAGYSATMPSAATLAANAPTAATASSILNAGNTVLPGELGDIAVNSSGQLLSSNGAVLNPTIAQGAAEVTPWQAEVARTQASTLTPANALTQGPAAKTGIGGMEMLGYGLAGTTALSLLGGMNQKKLSSDIPGQNPAQIRPYTYNVSQNQSAYPTTPQYGSNGLPILPTSEKSYFNQSYTAGTPYKAAAGGLMAAPPVPGMMQSGPADVNFMGDDMYPTSQQHRAYYATPTQMPTSAQEVMASYEPKVNPLTGQPMTSMASGGIAHFKSGGDDNFDSANYNASLSLTDMAKIRKRAMRNSQDSDDEIKKELMLDLMASPMIAAKMPGSDIGSENTFEKYMMSQAPQGFQGRVGVSKELDDDSGKKSYRSSKLRAGLSGIAMAQPGKHGVTAMPGAFDAGYTTAQKTEYDPYLDINAFRSINSVPGRGHEQGVNARYTIPFADGGITYDAATQTYQGLPSTGGSVADIPVLDAPPAVAQANQNPFSMFGGFGPMNEIGMAEQAAPVDSGQFTPATSLYKNELEGLTSQWQAANPNAKSYNAANQTYGAGKPTNAQLLAIKNAQAQQAYNDRLSAYDPFGSPGQGGGANGGLMPYNLGSYSDGGRLLKGPGDGVSDDIPAVIGNKQPARLADGEFVIPARIVSELGNGSTDAGAKRLYAMMDRIQSGRKKTVGKGKVAVNTKSDKHLPA